MIKQYTVFALFSRYPKVTQYTVRCHTTSCFNCHMPHGAITGWLGTIRAMSGRKDANREIEKKLNRSMFTLRGYLAWADKYSPLQHFQKYQLRSKCSSFSYVSLHLDNNTTMRGTWILGRKLTHPWHAFIPDFGRVVVSFYEPTHNNKCGCKCSRSTSSSRGNVRIMHGTKTTF